MMGNDINLSLKNIWQSWFAFRKGKRASNELHTFEYHLEYNLQKLRADLNDGIYRHGGYTHFTVCDNKRREIAVAPIRDRVVHRLIYDYLVPIYDHTFIYDAWSCRVGKGLLACIERTQKFLTAHPRSYVWRADIRKFFDNVDHAKLLQILARRVHDPKAFRLIREIISSFPTAQRERAFKGMPIGNLTSQIFANIYLNELDRFAKHELGVKNYLRYGDDFILIHSDLEKLMRFREFTIRFLRDRLGLSMHPTNDRIVRALHGLKFLGKVIWPGNRRLNGRNVCRIKKRLSCRSVGSYYGITHKHGYHELNNEFAWMTKKLIYPENE